MARPKNITTAPIPQILTETKDARCSQCGEHRRLRVWAGGSLCSP